MSRPNSPRMKLARLPSNRGQQIAQHGTSVMLAPIVLTMWTAAHPVTKRVWLDESGQVKKESASNLCEGAVTVLSLTAKQFVNTLDTIGPNDCFSYGIPINLAATHVVTRKTLERQPDRANVLSRTADAMAWPSGPAVLMIDYDPRGTAMSCTELLDRLYTLCPAICRAAHVWSASASSSLFNSKTRREVRPAAPGGCAEASDFVARDAAASLGLLLPARFAQHDRPADVRGARLACRRPGPRAGGADDPSSQARQGATGPSARLHHRGLGRLFESTT